jgi:hypothetical protein
MIDAMTSETVVPRRPNGARSAAVVLALLAVTTPAFAQGDVTFFLGGAYPVYDDRLTLRPSIPSLPGADVTVTGTPELRTNGGLVFGGALAFEAGIIGIEGRLDATEVGFDLTGARYDVRATAPPFEGLTAAVTVGDGHFDADRLYLLSLNVRLRTPGPIGLVASGGLSYLPDVTITGAVPLSVQISGVPSLPITPQVRLRVASGESEQRLGLNGGAGLRIGGSRVALMAEVRVFYFRDYELRFDVDDAPDIVGDLLDGIDAIRFEPVIVNAQAGLVFKF